MALRLKREILVDSSHWHVEELILVGSKNGSWLAVVKFDVLLESSSASSFCLSAARAMIITAAASADELATEVGMTLFDLAAAARRAA